MKRLLFLLFISCQISVFAQLKQKIADTYFSRMEYFECVDMYNELAKKTLKGKKGSKIENVQKAAVANFKLYKMKEACSFYTFLDKQANLSEEDASNYIQAERFIGNYKEATELIQKYGGIYPKNPFFAKLRSEEKDFTSLFADSSFSSIHKTDIHSFYGDFAPTYYEKGLIYATKSVNAETVNGHYRWDNSFYVSMLQSNIMGDSVVKNGKLLRHEFLDKAHDGPVAFTKDEQKMAITKNIFGKHKGKELVVLALYFSEKKDGKWQDLVPFEYNNSAYNVGHASFSDDGKTLYFVSDMEGGQGKTDIYRSQFDGSKWSKPENLGPTINTNLNELFPFVKGDRLFFASNGHFGLGGLDIFEVNLSKIQKPTNLGYPINSSADDFALICDSTLLNGYFSSNRGDAIDKIYSFVRTEPKIDLLVSVFEKYKENEIVSHQMVTISNEKTGEKETYYTNDKGQLELQVRTNESYHFTTSKTDFQLLKEEVLHTESSNKDTSYVVELYLKPTKITIALRVIAKDTKKPLEEATTHVYSLETGWDTLMTTNEYGLVTLTVDRNKNFFAHGSKKGYIDAEKGFSTSNEDGKIIELELELTPIKKGEKFKLENIFYDLNKSTLRSESMASLDRLADFIIKNGLKIELSAHTDSRGSAAYNQKLSQARAQSCINYLLTKGVKSTQMIAKGYGEAQLLNRCKDGVTCSEDEHQENRRTEVKILTVE